jgi:hypothetical protein
VYQLKGKPVTQRVTKKLAAEFAEMDPAPRDRPLSERRLSVYRSLWSRGLFRPCTWARAYCAETGGLYRVNGKHTSTLLAGLSEIPEFYVTVEDYQCDTLEDVAHLYGTFDSRLPAGTCSGPPSLRPCLPAGKRPRARPPSSGLPCATRRARPPRPRTASSPATSLRPA